jgi:hypothetical protein
VSVLVPLYGFVEGDTIGLIVLAHDDDPIARVIARLQHSARWRVAKFENARAFHGGRELDPGQTVAEAGITALERIDVRATAPGGAADAA